MKLAAALMALVFLAGCASSDLLHARSVTIPPGDIAEVNLVLSADDRVSWTWSVEGGAVTFNIHTHDGGGRDIFNRPGMTRDTGNFTAPVAGSYSLLWQNAGREPTTITYRITGMGKLDPHHAPVP